MKYLLCIILLFSIFSTNLAQAQQFPKQGQKYPNPGLKRISGTWVSIQGEDTLKIKFNFENIKLPVADLTADVLVGYILYKKGNQTIINDLKYSRHSYNDNVNEGKKSGRIFGLNDFGNDITGGLPDGLTSQSFQYKFTISTDLNTMIAIEQPFHERVYINEKPGKGYPDKMVFKRE